ncbi:hypothetical protein AB1Y20_019350 [Prymnesium parvum]|uniref:GTP cyclohydrolase II domain-containing protein n=2 Tax=Prymnesium parvum TaxID=97485 RepID=A0AB34JU34_PRYPA
MPGARGWPAGLPEPDGLAGGFVFGEASVVRALNELRKGSLVLLAEDGDKSSRFSFVVSPELVTTEQIDFLNQHAVRTQVALLPAAYQRVYESLHKIVLDNNNLARPALSVSVHGSGRSPLNSSHVASTVRALLHPNASAKLSCPGAVALSCAREGGVLRRAGATEAAVELCRLAGLPPLGMYAVANISGQSELRAFAEKWGLVYSSTADLIAFQRRRSALVERCAPPVAMPTKFGVFTAHCYRSLVDGVEHIALVKAQSGNELPHKLKPFLGSTKPALVRVHSECCTGDIFGSLRCDCGPQLEAGLRAIERDGWGVFLYLRGQEGRGIGLGAKIHAYSLQERGLDTLDANTELGLPVDSREYGTGAQILVDLGIRDMRLISNNPKKFTGLAGFGLRIVDREPSHTAPNKENIGYLRTKVQRMGHMLELGDSSDWAENGAPPPVSGGSQTSAASQDEE